MVIGFKHRRIGGPGGYQRLISNQAWLLTRKVIVVLL
jgi:hypothetical protein